MTHFSATNPIKPLHTTVNCDCRVVNISNLLIITTVVNVSNLLVITALDS